MSKPRVKKARETDYQVLSCFVDGDHNARTVADLLPSRTNGRIRLSDDSVRRQIKRHLGAKLLFREADFDSFNGATSQRYALSQRGWEWLKEQSKLRELGVLQKVLQQALLESKSTEKKVEALREILKQAPKRLVMRVALDPKHGSGFFLEVDDYVVRITNEAEGEQLFDLFEDSPALAVFEQLAEVVEKSIGLCPHEKQLQELASAASEEPAPANPDETA